MAGSKGNGVYASMWGEEVQAPDNYVVPSDTRPVTVQAAEEQDYVFSRITIKDRFTMPGKPEKVTPVKLAKSTARSIVFMRAKHEEASEDMTVTREQGLGKTKFQLMQKISDKINAKYCKSCKQYTRILKIDNANEDKRKQVFANNSEYLKDRLLTVGRAVTVSRKDIWDNTIMYFPFVGHVLVKRLGEYGAGTAREHVDDSGFQDRGDDDVQDWNQHLLMKGNFYGWSQVYELQVMREGYWLVSEGQPAYAHGLCRKCFEREYPLKHSTEFEDIPDPSVSEDPDAEPCFDRQMVRNHRLTPYEVNDLDYIAAVDYSATKQFMGTGNSDCSNLHMLWAASAGTEY